MKLPLAFVVLFAAAASYGAEKPRPLMRDFMGLCVHTVQFKPDLYRPVTSVVRDYHPVDWDTGKPPNFAPPFPLARNRVDWSKVYGSWKKAGYRAHASLMFDNMSPAEWGTMGVTATTYAYAFAKAFGPGSGGLLEAVEIGNEPGKYDDATYRTLFEAMARAMREADPKLRIAPCALNLGPSGRYSKSVDLLKGLEPLYDIVNIHMYPEVEGWPTWRRSFPEDEKIEFQRNLGHVLAWRREHAPDKELWITEFGWDASTKPAPATGTFAKWVGNTETQQARWIVRAYMIMAGRLDRAYLYFFNDKDDNHVHGSSGLTRNFQPKESFHAVAHLQRALGDYRFARIVPAGEGDLFVYEFVHGADDAKRVWAVWRAHSEPAKARVPLDGLKLVRAEELARKAGEPAAPERQEADGALELTVGEDPVFLWLERP